MGAMKIRGVLAIDNICEDGDWEFTLLMAHQFPHAAPIEGAKCIWRVGDVKDGHWAARRSGVDVKDVPLAHHFDAIGAPRVHLLFCCRVCRWGVSTPLELYPASLLNNYFFLLFFSTHSDYTVVKSLEAPLQVDKDGVVRCGREMRGYLVGCREVVFLFGLFFAIYDVLCCRI